MGVGLKDEPLEISLWGLCRDILRVLSQIVLEQVYYIFGIIGLNPYVYKHLDLE